MYSYELYECLLCCSCSITVVPLLPGEHYVVGNTNFPAAHPVGRPFFRKEYVRSLNAAPGLLTYRRKTSIWLFSHLLAVPLYYRAMPSARRRTSARRKRGLMGASTPASSPLPAGAALLRSCMLRNLVLHLDICFSSWKQPTMFPF
jgi:hypothetical protein